jgi:hypothetical protein
MSANVTTGDDDRAVTIGDALVVEHSDQVNLSAQTDRLHHRRAALVKPTLPVGHATSTRPDWEHGFDTQR